MIEHIFCANKKYYVQIKFELNLNLLTLYLYQIIMKVSKTNIFYTYFYKR